MYILTFILEFFNFDTQYSTLWKGNLPGKPQRFSVFFIFINIFSTNSNLHPNFFSQQEIKSYFKFQIHQKHEFPLQFFRCLICRIHGPIFGFLQHQICSSCRRRSRSPKERQRCRRRRRQPSQQSKGLFCTVGTGVRRPSLL